MDNGNWLIYGAYGYTGRRIAEEARGRGMLPVLAGRDAERVRCLAAELGCPSKAFSLDSVEQAAENLSGTCVVLNCAGPFSATATPMIEACLKAGVHYLDITGEIEAIEAAAARHARAAAAGVSLIPAVGFDVVPSDCLAAMLAKRLPTAQYFRLAFTFTGSLSPGTAKTMLEAIPGGGRVRVDGKILRVPWAWKTIEVPFPEGPRQAVSVPWGDVAAAWHSTGIGNIEVYLAMPPRQIRWLRRMRWMFPAFQLKLAQSFLRWWITRLVAGPSREEDAAGRCWLWGRVEDAAGNRVEALLKTPGGYPLTVSAALACVERVLTGAAPAGFSTPSKAFGAGLVLELPDTELQWNVS